MCMVDVYAHVCIPCMCLYTTHIRVCTHNPHNVSARTTHRWRQTHMHACKSCLLHIAPWIKSSYNRTFVHWLSKPNNHSSHSPTPTRQTRHNQRYNQRYNQKYSRAYDQMWQRLGSTCLGRCWVLLVVWLHHHHEHVTKRVWYNKGTFQHKCAIKHE